MNGRNPGLIGVLSHSLRAFKHPFGGAGTTYNLVGGWGKTPLKNHGLRQFGMMQPKSHGKMPKLMAFSVPTNQCHLDLLLGGSSHLLNLSKWVSSP